MGALSAVIAFVAVVQLRSQAQVQASLAGQSDAALAFLINDLHTAHDSLTSEAALLLQRRQVLQAGGQQAALDQLKAEQLQLQIVDGAVPVSGPGVVLLVSAPLQALDVQDAVNNLRIGGAEAISVNDHRMVTGTVIVDSGGQVLIDGTSVSSPYTFTAIGDPQQLAIAAELMYRALKADPRVSQVSYRSQDSLSIRAVVASRPFVYGTP